jgi:hypothetical protein
MCRGSKGVENRQKVEVDLQVGNEEKVVVLALRSYLSILPSGLII